MSSKPKISGRDTVILDNDTIDELDDMSLTSVIRDLESATPNPAAAPDDDPAASEDGEPSELTLADD